jgi:uncharacterized protein YjbI with pentapeptide repeats
MTPETFWGLVGLAAFLVMMIAVFGLLSGVKPEAGDTLLTRLRDRFGMAGLPEGVFALGLILWSVIFCALILGLLWTIISAAFHAPARTVESQTALRFVLISLTALTATLGAVVAFPVTLIRIALSRKQTETAEEALFNDKINAAAAGLAARRQVTRVINAGSDKESVVTEWEDDLVTRASAIDRLEGLANERPDITARVARMLSIYVRELSREHPAKEPPVYASPLKLREWAAQLTPIRPDMEKAVQCLGRLQHIDGHDIVTKDIDLRHANLQGFDLAFLNFESAQFDRAEMQGANLVSVEMQGAFLEGTKMQGALLWDVEMQETYCHDAEMQGAYFGNAKLQGADFWGAKMQGANFMHAELQGTNLHSASLRGAKLAGAKLLGADLTAVKMDENTDLTEASFRGSALSFVDETTMDKLRSHWADIFVDGSAQVPEGSRPEHWEDDILYIKDFQTRWHAWQDTLPDFDPSWRRN